MPLAHPPSDRRHPSPALAKKRDPEPGPEKNSLTKQPGMRPEITLTDNTDTVVEVVGATQVSVQHKEKHSVRVATTSYRRVREKWP